MIEPALIRGKIKTRPGASRPRRIARLPSGRSAIVRGWISPGRRLPESGPLVGSVTLSTGARMDVDAGSHLRIADLLGRPHAGARRRALDAADHPRRLPGGAPL